MACEGLRASLSGTALAGLALLLAACATPGGPRIESDRAPDADFATYETFSWASPAAPGGTPPPLSILDTNVRAAIRDELVARGYVESDVAPDFLVAYESARQDKVKSNPFRIGIGVGSWGDNVGGSVGVGTDSVESYEEGRLVIRAIESASNREVWVGSAADRMDTSGSDSKDVVRIVRLTLRDFPARVPR
jgi:hypothetical protein